jgi:glycerol uptake facilitator protein
VTALAKRCTAELVGTALLVYIGAGAAAITFMLSNGAATPNAFKTGSACSAGLRTGLLSAWRSRS